jgi:Domain of unknown function (DUF397)
MWGSRCDVKQPRARLVGVRERVAWDRFVRYLRPSRTVQSPTITTARRAIECSTPRSVGPGGAQACLSSSLGNLHCDKEHPRLGLLEGIIVYSCERNSRCPTQSIYPAKSWRTALRCGWANCVQVARHGKVILIGDSKQPSGPVLSYSPQEWEAFLGGAKEGDFDDMLDDKQ